MDRYHSHLWLGMIIPHYPVSGIIGYILTLILDDATIVTITEPLLDTLGVSQEDRDFLYIHYLPAARCNILLISLLILLFIKLRRYHTRPLRLNWGPENVHFEKTHFWDLNINVRILIFF